jgi:hypothetical protein
VCETIIVPGEAVNDEIVIPVYCGATDALALIMPTAPATITTENKATIAILIQNAEPILLMLMLTSFGFLPQLWLKII